MNLKAARTVHLYLGCLFAPMIIFFAVSGSWQVFDLHELKKNEPNPPARIVLNRLSKVHTQTGEHASMPFRVAVLAMAAGLIWTTALGVVMAFRFTQRPALVGWCLALGVLLPLALIALRLKAS